MEISVPSILPFIAPAYCQLNPKSHNNNLSTTDSKRGSHPRRTCDKRWLRQRYSGLLLLPLFLFASMPVFGAPVLSKISCGGTSFTGPMSKACSVYLSAVAQTATSVKLSSNNAAIWVPSSVTVYPGRSTAGFSPYIYAVQTVQTVTLTATSAGVSTALTIKANPAATAMLGLSSSRIAFSNTVVNTSATQSVIVSSTGTAPLTISAASISGSGFKLSGGTLPISLNPGQSTTLTVTFSPAGAGAASGTLGISSNSSNSPYTVISLSGAGVSLVSSLACSSTSIAFGNVIVSKSATAGLTLSSTGTGPVTISAAALSGTGFSLSGAAFPITLSPGQSLALTIQFAPGSVGAVTGQLTITSNSSTGSSTVINLTGAGAPEMTGTTYYLAPQANGGRDSNSGLSASQPWLSPNHPLNCGDVIIAAPSTAYDSNNFDSGRWGTVSCPSGNNVAWLQCATFDGCKISSTRYGMYVDKSYWGVQGWEVTVSAPGDGFCFGVAPQYYHPTNIHHVIFANNIANGCMAGGFTLFNVGTAGADYFTLIGNIVYNAAQGSAQCYSGISIFQPAQTDWAAGTHIYINGNFAWGNYEPNTCGGVQAWGGDGIILDTLDGSQGMSSAYTAQAVVENNISVGNGGYGIETQNNVAGPAHAHVIIANNTLWGNQANINQQYNHLCAELLLNSAYNVEERNNLVATKAQTACAGNPEYGFSAYTVDGTDFVHDNFAYASPNQASWVYNGPNYQFASSNVTGVDPYLGNPYVPGAPACGGTQNVPSCMATVIANFTPNNSSAASYGYHLPSGAPVSDPLFPQWLCNVNLPVGLVTPGCL